MKILRNGTPASKGLEKLRAEIAGYKAGISATLAAPCSIDAAVQKLRVALEQIQSADNPFDGFEQFACSQNGGASLPTPQASARTTVIGDGAVTSVRIPSNALMFALFGTDEIVARMRPGLEKKIGSSGLSDKQRADALQDLRTKLRKAEIAEEIEALKAEADGFVVLRRSDVDVNVLLEVWEKA